MPLKTYDESIAVLRRSLDAAKIDGGQKLDGFRRLDRFVRAVEEKLEPEANLEELVKHEFAISPSLEGRSVYDDKSRRKPNRQMSLF